MAVTRDGIPVRCWTFPGNEQDQKIIRTVKDDLSDVEPAPAGLGRRPRVRLRREPRLPGRGGGHYIHAGKLRNTNGEAAAALARQGRYHEVAGNLRVKEVWVPPRTPGNGPGGSPSATTPSRPSGTGRPRAADRPPASS